MPKALQLIAVLFVFTSSIALADGATKGKPLTVDQIRELDEMTDAVQQIEKLQQDLKVLTRQRRTDCLLAFGHAAFCECLMSNLPLEINLRGYVEIVTTPKDKLGYSKLSKDHRLLVDNSFAARNKCVNEIGQ
jgi:hypothetical protein